MLKTSKYGLLLLILFFFSCKKTEQQPEESLTVLWNTVNDTTLSDSLRSAHYSKLAARHPSLDSALLLREALSQKIAVRPEPIMINMKIMQDIRYGLLSTNDLDQLVVDTAFTQKMQTVLTQYPLHQNPEMLAYCYHWLFYAYCVNGRLKEGLKWIEFSKDHLPLIQPDKRSVIMLHTAQIYISSGHYIKAIEQLNKTIELARQHNLYYDLGQAYFTLGDLFFILNLTEKEKDAYAQSIPPLETYYQQDYYFITKFQIQVTKLLLAQSEKEALAYRDSAMLIIKENDAESLRFSVEYNMANYYWKNNQLDKAIELYRQVIQLNQQSGSWTYALNNQSLLSKLLLQNGQIDAAIELGTSTAKTLDSLGFNGSLLGVYETLSQAYIQKKQLDRAFFYQNKKDLLAVEVNGSTQATTVQAITFLEKELAANSLLSAQMEKLATEAQLEQHKKMLIWLAMSLMIITAFGLVYYLNNKVKQKAAQDMEAANKALLNEQEKLKRSNEQLYRFTRVVSHDVITNLDLILSAGNIYRAAPNDQYPQTQYYTITQNVSRQLKDYCVELLDESRKEVPPGAPLNDPMPILQQILERFQPAIQSANVQVDLAPLAPMPLPTVIIEQLFQNLVSNTLRYGITAPNPTLKIADEKDALGRPCCIVEDNGPGIPADKHELIFEVGDESSPKGQGIGLSLLRTSLRQHNADIWVEDRPGGGTRWVVLFGQ